MSKKRLIFYLLWIFLINVNFVLAYHGSLGGGTSISPIKAVVILVGAIIIFSLIIWFFRKMSVNQKKRNK